MKNRRLNVLFIAIIALAAAPQAFYDAYRLANAAQERAESEFWSVFLSYQMPEADGAQTARATELMAARSQQPREACALERMAARASEAARSSQSNETAPARVRVISAEAKGAKTILVLPETVEADSDGADEVASALPSRSVLFSEKEQKALRASGIHARDIERIADAASKASLASFRENGGPEIKVRQAMEMDKLLRQKTRNSREKGESLYEFSTPNTVGSM
ncbi:MAG: hypothetical protein ICV60_14650 [Pyrinomonadaceae bacterium]|nr:hypothetical protein [Pyrinomonadaceae bacterium]